MLVGRVAAQSTWKSPVSSAFAFAARIHRSAVDLEALIRLSPWVMFPELEGDGQRGVKLRVDRHDSRLGSLAAPGVDRRQTGVQRQFAYLERKRLRHPEPGAPLYQEQESCPRVRSGAYQHVDLVGLEVLRK